MKSWIPWGKGKKEPAPAVQQAPVLLPAPDAGKISKVDSKSRFVVLTFPVGSLPSNGQKLNVYRNNFRVAELRVTGPQQENNTVADIIAGEPQMNDQVRID